MAVVLVATALVCATPAQASTSFEIAFSDGGVRARTGPSTSYPAVGSTLRNGTAVSVSCESVGRAVTNTYRERTALWERLSNGRWVPNAYVDTKAAGRTPGVPSCTYSPTAAVAWAKSQVTAKETFRGNDCAWYASHALWAGGVPMSSSWTESTSSLAAKNANAFAKAVASSRHTSLKRLSWRDNTAGGAVPGDVIAYDWNGDRVVDHVAVVTRLNSKRYPYVAQHSPAQADRYWSWSATAKTWIHDAHPHSVAYRVHP